MFKLLPHHCKKIGLIAVPFGFFLWFAMQKNYVTSLVLAIGIDNVKPINVTIAVIGFFSFLLGIYALAFSKEKIEDEFIREVRFESLQIAGFVQLVFLIFGFILIALNENSIRKDTIMLFFVGVIFIFWLVYILRFNYKVHIEIYRYEK